MPPCANHLLPQAVTFTQRDACEGNYFIELVFA
jgi:hypothetical protein